MDPGHFQRIQEIFEAAADLPPTKQVPFLNSACGDDPEALTVIQAMLEEDGTCNSILDQPIESVAAEVLDDDPSHRHSVRLGPYCLRRVLGEGGMGTVYLAERSDIQTLVAIKVLRDAWLSPARHERFLNEQRTLAHLIHPSIARLYDAGILADRTPWFAMEYVDGSPITEFCRRHNCTITTRLVLFRAVCEAIHFAHQRAIIHRDIKPSNIFVKEDSTVRLLDFGIARQLDALDQPIDQTRTELRCMTPAYAAPEQIRGERVGVFSDVYSLGVLLYELITGVAPYRLANRAPAEAERIILEHQPERPSLTHRAQSATAAHPPPGKAQWPDLDVLCLTAMHKDVTRRYASVEGLIRDIDHYLAQQPLDARPDSVAYRLERFAVRNHQTVSVAVVIAALLAAVVFFFTLRLNDARNAALNAAARTDRVQRFMFSLFNGDPATAPSTNMRVLTLIDHGAAQVNSLSAEPELQADLYETLGILYQKLGRFPKAETLFRNALHVREAHAGMFRNDVARSWVLLGLLRLEQARFGEADQLIRRGYDETRRLVPEDCGALAFATSALGKSLIATGNYQGAIPLLNTAIQLQTRSSPNNPELAATIKELADAHFYLGQYDKVLALTAQALAIHRKAVGDKHPLVSDDLLNFGGVALERGEYTKAETYYRRALAIDQDWFGANRPETASALYMLGEDLVYQQRYTEAEPLLLHAFAVRQQAYGPLHPRVANVLNELCSIYSGTNQLDKAEACFNRVVTIYRTAYSDHHYLVALSLSNLASVYFEKHQYARAEQLFREVVDRFTRALSATHVYTAIAKVKLGRCLLREKRPAEAEPYSRAGYEVLRKQVRPHVAWRHAAQEDLLAIYQALNEPDKATFFRNKQQLSGNPESGT